MNWDLPVDMVEWNGINVQVHVHHGVGFLKVFLYVQIVEVDTTVGVKSSLQSINHFIQV